MERQRAVLIYTFVYAIYGLVPRRCISSEKRLKQNDVPNPQVEDTDKKLETLSWKMERWERAVSEVSLVECPTPQQEFEQQSCVMNLLQDVTQVRYNHCHRLQRSDETRQLCFLLAGERLGVWEAPQIDRLSFNWEDRPAQGGRWQRENFDVNKTMLS